jgi:hypothetical protein
MPKKSAMDDLLGRYTHQQIPASELMVRGDSGHIYIKFQTSTEEVVIVIAPDQVLDLVRLLEDVMTNLSRRSVRQRFAFVPFAGDAQMCIGLNFTTCRPSALPGISLTRSPYRLSAAIVHVEARGLTGDRADDFAGVAVPMPCPLRIPATRMPPT